VGVGGDTGKEPIWDKSLLAKLKAPIKLAVGITMYQETFEHFDFTMKGVVQGIMDLYYDQDPASEHFTSWETFKDQVVVILIADGYANIGADFKRKAEERGFFRDSAITDTFFKTTSTNERTLMSFQEVREILKVRMETEDDPGFSDDEMAKNLVHCFQCQVPLSALGSTLELTEA